MNEEWLDSLGLVSGEGRFYEDWRQEDLTIALGQVHCSTGTGLALDYGSHIWPMDKPCSQCGAAL